MRAFSTEGGFLVKIESKMLGNCLLGEVAIEIKLKPQEIVVRGDASGGRWRFFGDQVNERSKEVVGFKETLE